MCIPNHTASGTLQRQLVAHPRDFPHIWPNQAKEGIHLPWKMNGRPTTTPMNNRAKPQRHQPIQRTMQAHVAQAKRNAGMETTHQVPVVHVPDRQRQRRQETRQTSGEHPPAIWIEQVHPRTKLATPMRRKPNSVMLTPISIHLLRRIGGRHEGPELRSLPFQVARLAYRVPLRESSRVPTRRRHRPVPQQRPHKDLLQPWGYIRKTQPVRLHKHRNVRSTQHTTHLHLRHTNPLTNLSLRELLVYIERTKDISRTSQGHLIGRVYCTL